MLGLCEEWKAADRLALYIVHKCGCSQLMLQIFKQPVIFLS